MADYHNPDVLWEQAEMELAVARLARSAGN
jgi:hypothetical protein